MTFAEECDAALNEEIDSLIYELRSLYAGGKMLKEADECTSQLLTEYTSF